jgi:hypothetical protein
VIESNRRCGLRELIGGGAGGWFSECKKTMNELIIDFFCVVVVVNVFCYFGIFFLFKDDDDNDRKIEQKN